VKGELAVAMLVSPMAASGMASQVLTQLKETIPDFS